MSLLGKDARLTLLSYTDAEFSSGQKKVELKFRPDSLKTTQGNKIDPSCTINGISGDGAFTGGKPATLKLTFLLDATAYSNAIAFALGKQTVAKQLKTLDAALYSMVGKTHEPRFVIIKWGKLKLSDSKGGGFYGRLTDKETVIKITAKDGTPILAEVTCTFVENLSPKKSAARAGRNSPDLTHSRLMTSADTLALQSQDIYRDPAYMTAVAEFNGLDSLRGPLAGTSLSFPPLED